MSLLAPAELAVKEQANEAARTLFLTQPGESLWKTSEEGDYSRIKVKHKGKWVTGYVLSAELEGLPELEGASDKDAGRGSRPEAKALSRLGLGFGAVYARLSQTGKTFQTDDEVKYTLSSFTSQSYWPFLVAQWRRQDFWRLRFGYRITKFQGTAKTDVSTNADQSVEIYHRMLSLSADRTWSFGPAFVGGGLEASKALSLSLKLGGRELPTSAQDLPTYIGLGAVIGLQEFLSESVSLYGELRVTDFVNQQQPITALEAAAAAVYWY